jgi:hypothetical protein
MPFLERVRWASDNRPHLLDKIDDRLQPEYPTNFLIVTDGVRDMN